MEYLNSCEKKRHRETTIVNDSAPSAIEKNSDFGSDCNALKDTTYITFSDKRSTPGTCWEDVILASVTITQHYLVMRGSGVLYRIRPLLEKGAKSSIHVTQQVIQVQHRNRNKIFQCEQILQPSQSQEQVGTNSYFYDWLLLVSQLVNMLFNIHSCLSYWNLRSYHVCTERMFVFSYMERQAQEKLILLRFLSLASNCREYSENTLVLSG